MSDLLLVREISWWTTIQSQAYPLASHKNGAQRIAKLGGQNSCMGSPDGGLPRGGIDGDYDAQNFQHSTASGGIWLGLWSQPELVCQG
jgi:hypothetical protein